jgi:hypothetical protein
MDGAGAAAACAEGATDRDVGPACDRCVQLSVVNPATTIPAQTNPAAASLRTGNLLAFRQVPFTLCSPSLKQAREAAGRYGTPSNSSSTRRSFSLRMWSRAISFRGTQ